MNCPRCHGTNVSVQAISEVQRRGCLTVFIYFLLCITIIGIFVVFFLMRGRKSKTKSIGVCQDCGFRFEVKNKSKTPIYKTKIPKEYNVQEVQPSPMNYINNAPENVIDVDDKNNNILKETHKFINEEIYNQGLFLIKCYIMFGINPSDDSEIDIDLVLDTLKKKSNLLPEYKEYIAALPLIEYKVVKEEWGSLADELSNVLLRVWADKPVRNQTEDLGIKMFNEKLILFNNAVERKLTV